VNSYLEFLIKRIAIHFRKRLTHYFHERYIKDMIFYQISNLDCRVANPDQRLTVDIEKWAMSLSSLYSNFSKPLLDIVLFSRRLAELVGWEGPGMVFVLYIFNVFVLRFISPPFGKLTAMEQRFEGEFRGCHTDLVHHAEEIAFCRGDAWEKNRITLSFDVSSQITSPSHTFHRNCSSIHYTSQIRGCSWVASMLCLQSTVQC
jgi:ATP-binding cassette subfamily D (ALD) protein 3